MAFHILSNYYIIDRIAELLDVSHNQIQFRISFRGKLNMESNIHDEDDNLVQICISGEEMYEETILTSSEGKSSTPYCSLLSEGGKNIRSFQRHQSVDDW